MPLTNSAAQQASAAAAHGAAQIPHAILHLSMFDYIAIGAGIACAMWAYLFTEKCRRDAAILGGYAAGQAIAYLGGLAITLLIQSDGYDTIANSNPGFLFLAFAYGAFMSSKTLPWFDDLKNDLKDGKKANGQ